MPAGVRGSTRNHNAPPGGFGSRRPIKKEEERVQKGVVGDRREEVRRSGGGTDRLAAREDPLGLNVADDAGDDPNKRKKFSNRCRLFIGSLPSSVKESELRELFTKYGEISECSVSDKGFAFVRMDTRAHTELVKEALDGHQIKGRRIRVRYALNPGVCKLKEIPPYVSNELLFEAFSRFGEVERAVHFCDEKARPLGEGIVEFSRRSNAEDCAKDVQDGIFLLTTNPKPIICEKAESQDDEGIQDKMLPRGPDLFREREEHPRFARRGTFEFEFGQRWKQQYLREKLRRDKLEQEFTQEREALESEMEIAYQQFKADQIREDLKRKQDELERLERETQEKMEYVKRYEEEQRARSQFQPGGGGFSIPQGGYEQQRYGGLGGPPHHSSQPFGGGFADESMSQGNPKYGQSLFDQQSPQQLRDNVDTYGLFTGVVSTSGGGYGDPFGGGFGGNGASMMPQMGDRGGYMQQPPQDFPPADFPVDFVDRSMDSSRGRHRGSYYGGGDPESKRRRR